MLILMNSAMMPQPGKYTCEEISPEKFRQIFQTYQDDYKSYLGYPNACKVVSELVGRNVPLCRDMTDLRNGDIILAVRLRYRVNFSEKSGKPAREHGQKIEDYQFFLIHYCSL